MCFHWLHEPSGRESREPGVRARQGWAGASPGLRASASFPRPQACSLQTRTHPDPGGRDPTGPGGDASPTPRRADAGPPPSGTRRGTRKLTSGRGLAARSSVAQSSWVTPLPLSWSPSEPRVAASTLFQAPRPRRKDPARLPRCSRGAARVPGPALRSPAERAGGRGRQCPHEGRPPPAGGGYSC